MTTKNSRERLKQVLDDLGVEMKTWGCSCCGSPRVTFKYQGKTIVDNEHDFNFDSNADDLGEEEPWEQKRNPQQD